METTQILAIISLLCLLISLVSSLFPKIPIIVKNCFFLVAIILLAISQIVKQEDFEQKNRSLLNVIITASCIPSHPSIQFIRQTIQSLKLMNLPPYTRIILAHDHDGKERIQYIKYLEKLSAYIKPFPNIQIVKRKTNGHLTGNIRNALKYVNSKYILVVQHDLPFIKAFDIQKVIQDMEENNLIKHVRFNHRENVKENFDGINNLFGRQVRQTNYTYTRTPGWSDRNHICLKSYYTNVVMKECPDGAFMEQKLQGKITNTWRHDKYGTYLFGELEHEPMIKHTDGRNSR